MLPFYLFKPALWNSAFSMITRLKPFFISILFVYLFLSPVSLSDMSNLNILLQVCVPGLFRISVLISIIFAVNLYLKTTDKEEILASLIWLFKPLNYFNINIDRMALRAVMTLEYIEYLNHKLTKYKRHKLKEKQQRKQVKESYRQILHNKQAAFFKLVSQSAIILHDVLTEAESTAGKQYTIDCLQAPVLIQFMIPAIISLLLFLSL